MILQILQVVVSVGLIVLILLQERSSGLSGSIGGSTGSTPYQARRGLEKWIFRGTVILGVVFALLALINLLI